MTEYKDYKRNCTSPFLSSSVNYQIASDFPVMVRWKWCILIFYYEFNTVLFTRMLSGKKFK